MAADTGPLVRCLRLHQQPGATTGDVGDDGSTSMQFRDCTEVDCKGQIDSLTLAQPEA